MKTSDRQVITLPLTELWDDSGPVPAEKERQLSRDDLRVLLRSGPIRFVIADVGSKLRWVDHDQCWSFWQTEARDRVTDPGREALNSCASYDGLCYIATQWHLTSGESVVLLEAIH